MRMKNKDLIALSAYLDNQLKVGERERLEKRLTVDSDLQEALETLRQTRLLLRKASPIKAPRNFSLTLEMVGVKVPKAQTYPGLRWAFAVASLMFIFVFFGDVARLYPWMATAERDNAAFQSAPVRPIWPPVADGMGGGGGGFDVVPEFAPEASSTQAEAKALDSIEAEEDAAPSVALESDAGALAMESPENREMLAAPRLMEEESEPGATVEPVMVLPSPEEFDAAADPQLEGKSTDWARIILTAIEITLALAALGSLGFWLYLRQRDW